MSLVQEKYRELAETALKFREKAYCPYSGFAVGAALLCSDGSIYAGVNVENAAYSPSNCAERTAVFSAVAQGHTEFEAIAVAGGMKGAVPEDFCPPCGVCRQVLSEFCGSEFKILMVRRDGEIKETTLKELLPESFSLSGVSRKE